jgi:hypothetical protein
MPEREIFDLSFLTLINPIWVVEMGTERSLFYHFALECEVFSAKILFSMQYAKHALEIQNGEYQPQNLK